MIILWLPLLQMTLSLFPEKPGTENRTLSEKPVLKRFSLGAVLSYPKEYEMYFNDHFGFRNYLVRLNSLSHVRLAATSPTERVVIGEDKWLFYDDPKDGVNLKDYAGEANFTADELAQIKDKIIKLNERLRANKIHFIVAIIPNKHTIYPEKLPLSVARKGGKITRIGQVSECLIATGVDLVDLRQKLLSNKSLHSYPLYYRTDTHWNNLGAFLGYEEIMTHVKAFYPIVAPMKLSDFVVRLGNNRDIADLAGFINIQGSITDPEIILEPKMAKEARPIPVAYESMAGCDTVGAMTNDKGLPKLVMFRDSFADGLIPYLSENFSRSVYVWKPKMDFRVIEQEKPDVVIFEVVERYLGALLSIQ
ncbi:MAG: hypothetical protein ACHQ0Y_03295 [Thermodesulfovibrionales bacterium]